MVPDFLCRKMEAQRVEGSTARKSYGGLQVSVLGLWSFPSLPALLGWYCLCVVEELRLNATLLLKSAYTPGMK